MKCPCISNNELVSRFIVYSRWIRKNKTIRSDAFMPGSSLETSVTRHLGISEQDIWKAGELTAGKSPRKLFGRGDVEAGCVRKQGLDVEPRPEINNPNHANIVDWPDKKDMRKNCAQLIAGSAKFIAVSG